MPALTYTLTDDGAEGTWAVQSTTLGDLPGPLSAYPFPLSYFAGPAWHPEFTLAAPSLDALFYFTAMDSSDSVLSLGTLLTTASVETAGSGPWRFELRVVVEHSAAPSTAAIPRYRYARVGTLTILNDWSGALNLPLTLGAQAITGNFLWNPDPQGGLGAVNAAWRQAAYGVSRSLVFAFAHQAGEVSLTFEAVSGLVLASLSLHTSSAERSFYRCPRCGMPTMPDELVRDGYTKSYVCSRCYDPPVPPRDWKWPFVDREET